MASDIAGLFMTPEQYQMMQQQSMEKQAADYAALNPVARGEYSAYLAGGQIGQGLRNFLGAQDPQLRLISQRQQLSQGLDMTDPNAVMQIAQQAAQLGDTQFATALADYARKAQVDIATAQQKMREKTGVSSEIQIAQTRADLQDRITQLEAMPVSPERNRALAMARNTLAGLPTTKAGAADKDIVIAERRAAAQGLQPGTDKYNSFIDAELLRLTTKEGKANVKEVGVAEGTRAPVYLDVNTDEQFIYTKGADGKQMRQPYFGGVDRTTSKTELSISQVGEKEFAKTLGGEDAKRVKGAMDTKDNAIASLTTLQEMSRLNDKGLISGTYATGRVGAANLLNTLGLVSPKDQVSLASSEQFQKQANDLVLATLGGKLGAGFSNEDRKFIQSIVPQLENSAAARRNLINFMIKKQTDIINETTRLETYARENNSLKGYTPKLPLPSTPKTGASALTDQQLIDALKKAKPKGK